MRTIRLRCETRAEIDGRVRREYGETARVVAVEEVLTGGIGGFFARRHLDVSVAIPDPADESVDPAPAPDGGHSFSSRSGLARLLEDADADEFQTGFAQAASAAPAGTWPLPTAATDVGALAATPLSAVPRGEPGPAVLGPYADPLESVAAPTSPSTAGRDFEALLSSLSSDVGVDVPPAPPTVSPLGPVEVASPPAVPGSRRAAMLSERKAHRPSAVPDSSASATLSATDATHPGTGGARVAPPTTPLFRVSSRAPAAPAPLSGPGDLVVVAGFGHDSLEAAVLVGRLAGCDQVFDAGTVRGNSRRRVDDRRSAIVARAGGVQSGRAAVVAFGLDPAAGGVEALADLEPDQLWLAVDVSRKVADTDLWVGQVRLRARIDGIVPTGELYTASPETIDLLGLPVLRGRGTGSLPPARA